MPKGKLRKRAQRDVEFANQPYLDELERQERLGKDDLNENQERVNSIYDALAAELTGINFNQGAQGIADQYSSDISGLADLLGTSTPAGEQAAAAGLLGNLGAGGLTMLASNAQRNVAYNASTKRQGAIERSTLRRNYLEDYRDLLDDIKNARIDVKQNMGQQLQTRLDDLRDQRFSRRLQERELAVAEEQFNKQFGLQKRQVDNEESESRRAQQAATQVLSKAERRTKLKRKDNRITRRIGNVKEKIAEASDGNTWGWEAPQTGEYAYPTLDSLYDKLGKLKDRRKGVRKRRRSI